jgi:MarR family transcriptional regulator for hemolysin
MTENLDSIIFYSLEKAIKVYRQFAQRTINASGFTITIDQWLVLKALEENPEQTQHEIAETVFKDHASLTRMIELLVNKNFLERTAHPNDRRRFRLTITNEARNLLKVIQPLIDQNRSTALTSISPQQASNLRESLSAIINNCKI